MSGYLYRTLMKPITNPEAAPSVPHYAMLIFVQQNVHIPGDERSRTAPGHGYPERTETYNTNNLWVTEHKEDWEQSIADLYTAKPGRKDILAYHVDGVAEVKMQTTIKVGT